MATFDVPNLLNNLQRERFYGSLEVKFEAGKIVLLRKTETFKTDDELRGTRNSYGTSQ
jgi:hypothetical protein